MVVAYLKLVQQLVFITHLQLSKNLLHRLNSDGTCNKKGKTNKGGTRSEQHQ